MRRRRVIAGLVGLALVAGIVTWRATRPPPAEPAPARAEIKEVRDPIEDDPKVRPLLAEADAVAGRQLKELQSKQGRLGKPQLGDVHNFWAFKKQYLKERYGIDWRTPAEMNPHFAYD